MMADEMLENYLKEKTKNTAEIKNNSESLNNLDQKMNNSCIYEVLLPDKSKSVLERLPKI